MIVTKTEFATELGCAKSTISGLVAKGLPVRADGRLNRERALRWIVNATSGHGGGWGSSRGRAVAERAEVLLRGEQAARTPRKPAPVPLADQVHAGRVAALEDIARPAEVLRFARVALRAGCTPEQAFALAGWFSVAPCLALPNIDAEDVRDFTEPTRQQWMALLGANFDFDAAEALEDRATAPEVVPEAA